MTPEAERFNGWAAMLGFVAAVGAYATTGNIIPEHILMTDKGIKKVAEQLNGRLAMLKHRSMYRCIPNNRTNHSWLCVNARVVRNKRNITLYGNPMVFLPHRYCCFLQSIV